MRFEWVVVGAGFAGSVISERIASQLNQKVLLIERRSHIGGNAYDYYSDEGCLVHRYGPHIFHTNDQEVWDYLSRFTRWRPYYHQVLAEIDGVQVPLPFNLNSLHALFPLSFADSLEKQLINRFGFGSKVPILKLREQDDPDISFLADYIYEKVFKNYSFKQWGMNPEELDSLVTSRVPVFVSRDNRYFQDKYQAVPLHGYSNLFQSMLSHHNIKLLLNTSFHEVAEEVFFKNLIFTGPIDDYFNFKFGPLPYRSLRFDIEIHEKELHQRVGTVNYPNEYEFTRITETKHLTGQQAPRTSLLVEYPCEYSRGRNEPYYPILTPSSREQYNEYLKEANSQENLFFCGRLGDFKYYNMDQVVANALRTFERISSRYPVSAKLPRC